MHPQGEVNLRVRGVRESTGRKKLYSSLLERLKDHTPLSVVGNLFVRRTALWATVTLAAVMMGAALVVRITTPRTALIEAAH